VLTAHAYDIGSTLRRVEQEGQRQPCLRSDRVLPLEYFDLVFGPGMEAGWSIPDTPDTDSRVISAPVFLDRKHHQRLDHTQPMICRSRRRHLVRQHCMMCWRVSSATGLSPCSLRNFSNINLYVCCVAGANARNCGAQK
jgi:hypothetical protein